MEEFWINLLQYGFPGFACFLLGLACRLLHQVVALPSGDGLTEKRKLVQFFCIVCVIVLVLSVGSDVIQEEIKPKLIWIKASAYGQFSNDEFKQRPLALNTYLAGGDTNDFRSIVLKKDPIPIEIPANGGSVVICVPGTNGEDK